MVALYHDPKGEKVFSEYDTQPSFKSQQGAVAESSAATTDSALRKRIVELENIISTNKVATHIAIFVHVCSPRLANELMDSENLVEYAFIDCFHCNLISRLSTVNKSSQNLMVIKI